jgi:BASS family bile acid:Na+ symporter
MTLDKFINILVTVTLFEMMVAIGLSVTVADLLGVARNLRLIIRAVVANYVVVPAVTVALLFLFEVHTVLAAGFLILAVCPGAPFGPPFVAIAKGNVAVAVGLMAILAGSSAILAPVLLHYLLMLVEGDPPLDIDAVKIVITLLTTQLAPLAIGVALRHWRPHLADRLLKPATLLSKVLNLLAVGFILVAQFQLLLEIPLRGFAGMLLLLMASGAAGWLLAGRDLAIRKSMTLTASLRNVGVGLVIVTGSFAGTPAVTSTVVYGLFEVLVSLLLAIVWGRSKLTPSTTEPAATPSEVVLARP